MQRILLFTALAAFMASAITVAQQSQSTTSRGSSQISSQDRNFIETTAKDNQKEIEMGQLAEQKASNSMVKSFGQKLVSDHTMSQQELETIASKNGVSIVGHTGTGNTGVGNTGNSRSTSSTSSTSTSPGSTDPEYQRLSRMSGSEFDRAFVMQMVQDHEKAVSMFQQQLNNTNDPQLKNYINMTLPVLRSHLDQARSLERSLGKS